MAALNRLSQRIKENFQETTRDISILSGSAGPSATSYFDTADDRTKETSKLLDSRNDREVLEAMRRIIAGISKGRNMESFFPQIVKLVAVPSIEIRKLVYIYLLRFASTNSELLLLSINTFQKDLSDPSPLVRCMALRILTSIRVQVIQGIVMLGLKKLVNDRNPWVRKAVASGLAKVYEMDSSSMSSLIPLLQTLLASQSPLTLGATLSAFSEVCPDRLDLLHPYFRHICRLLVDTDEWGQIVAVEVLTRYCRVMLERPETEPIKQSSEESEDEFGGIDLDLAMFLDCARLLLQSRNPAVVLAVAKAYYHLAPEKHNIVGQSVLVTPLLRMAMGTESSEIAALVWNIIGSMASERPWLFRDHLASAFLSSADPVNVKLGKLRTMMALASTDTADVIIRELKFYVRFPETAVAAQAIESIGTFCRLQPSVTSTGLSILMKLLKSHRDQLVAQAVLALKSIILSIPESSTTIKPRQLVTRLAKQLPGITNPHARASVFWLVGEYAGNEELKSMGWEGIAPWVPDVLRQGVRCFAQEATPVKLQILTSIAKVTVLTTRNNQLSLLCHYLFALARYDNDYDVRDRSRLLSSLLRGIISERTVEEEEEQIEDMGGVILRREQIKAVLTRHGDTKERHLNDKNDFDIGTLSSILGRKLLGYEDLPEWTSDPTDSSLRDSEIDRPKPLVPTSISSSQTLPPPATVPLHISPPFPRSAQDDSPAGSVPAQIKSKFKDLDAFLDSESEEETEEESEEEVQPPRILRTTQAYEMDSSEEEDVSDENSESDEEKPLQARRR